MNQPNAAYVSVQQNTTPSIMDAFRFTADDLSANRMGTVSDQQRSQLKTWQGQWQKQLAKVIGLMLVVAAVYIFLFPQGAQIREIFSQNVTIIAPVIGAILLFWVIMIAYYWGKARRMSNSQVSRISGPVKLVGHPVQSVAGPRYQRIKIGKRLFYMTDVQAFSLTPDATYTAYFVGGGQMAQIIAVEPAANS